MKLLIATACAIVAALQTRLSRARVDSYNARKALADARLMHANGAHDLATAEAESRAARLAAIEEVVAEELRDIAPQFGYVLRQFPAANDPHFNPPTERG